MDETAQSMMIRIAGPDAPGDTAVFEGGIASGAMMQNTEDHRWLGPERIPTSTVR
jgi:hypothetical protein